MSTLVRCPKCECGFEIEDRELGNAVRCRNCNGLFLAIDAEPASVPEKSEGAVSGSEFGAEIPENLLPVNLVDVDAGSFMQGSVSGGLFERPPRRTRITYNYQISRNEVSQREYYRTMGSNPSYFRGEDLPVETVSWHEAMDFCRKLTRIARLRGHLPDDKVYRLPTETEWEYACRTSAAHSGDGEVYQSLPDYWWGDDPAGLDGYGWYADNSDGRTHPVGMKEANPRGLRDMTGNVSEWCLDWFAPYDGKEVSDPRGPDMGTRKVRRGGSWGSIAWRCRATDRLGVAPDCRSALLGFRVVVGPRTGSELPDIKELKV